MGKRSLIWVVAVLVVGVLGFFALAHRAEIPPIEPPAAATFSPELIARGEILATAGNCESCHTTLGGQHFAGGLGIGTPFGTIYTSNVTPDPVSGIGRWSEPAFARALHAGVARDGSHLYPAFPFDHFTRVTDDDVQALYAYLMTRRPVNRVPPANTVPFPLNIRALQWGWKLLFFHPGVYRPDPAKSEAWNRGAYLSEGLAHCAACHSPRNALGASKTGSHAYTGGMVDGWVAPALTAANPAPLPWTEEELYGFLRTGGTALHGVAAASMSEVIHFGLAKLPDADVKAIATYFADMNGAATRGATVSTVLAKAMSVSGVDEKAEDDPGDRLYMAACASCHYNRGPEPLIARPELALNSALTAAQPTNLVQVVLHGIGLEDGAPGLFMPPFAHLSDAEIASLGAYLRRTRTDQPAWTDLEGKVTAIRRSGSGS
ncbi:MAG TPA: cytochrome c [Burkholderiales bacterium]|nr:cytochrome c [Burkholderiales bacterium]